MKKVLTIAGSDPFGGAGLQADLKTMTAHKVYGLSAVTLVSSQNTQKFNEAIATQAKMLEDQIDLIFEDIDVDALKTGMLFNKTNIKIVSEKIKKYKPKNVVIDPVMVAHREIRLIDEDAIDYLLDELIPLADIITPNLGEAEIIANMKINNEEDMISACKEIYEKYNCYVLIKSGVNPNNSNDLLYYNGEEIWLKSKKVDNKNTRGTGCSLSAAIASNLSKGYDMKESCMKAKRFITKALESNLQIGKGIGPIDHYFDISGEY